MNNSFKGWTKVFSFTLEQLVKTKAYLTSTILISLVCLIAPILICMVDVDSQIESDDLAEITDVVVWDNSGFEQADYSLIGQINPRFENTKIEMILENADEEEILNTINEKGTKCAGAIIQKNEDSFSIEVYISEESELSEDDGESIAEAMSMCMEEFKYANAGFNEEQMITIKKPVTLDVSTIGEGKESIGLMLVRTFGPMITGLIMYFMVLLYGQTISKSMLTEKTSKIIELMMTSTSSISMFVGKIFAMIFGAVIQLAIWVISVIGGYNIGVYMARTKQEDYTTGLGELLKMLRDNNAMSAFSTTSIIISIAAIVLGFVLFSVLAGAVGAFINRAEDMGSVMMWFQYSVVIGFFIPYFASMQGNKDMIMVGRYFPLCIPFSLPADVLIGNVEIMEGCISLLILVVTTVIMILAAGRIYKAMIFYNGDKPKFKNIVNMIIGKE